VRRKETVYRAARNGDGVARKIIVLAVLFILTSLVLSLIARAQDTTNDQTPTFYRLVPGTYVNAWPRFTITYPKEWVEVRPNTPEVFRAGVPGGEHWALNLFPDPTPLDKAAEAVVGWFKNIAQEVRLVSDKPTQLRDGSPAREFQIQMLMNGEPASIICLATKKGDLLVQPSVNWRGWDGGDHLKAILYSLEFQSSFDKPVKVPPDVQKFLDEFSSDMVSHDVARVMSHYSERFLSSGSRKPEMERFHRDTIDRVTSCKITVTDFKAAENRAYLAGFEINHLGRVALIQGSPSSGRRADGSGTAIRGRLRRDRACPLPERERENKDPVRQTLA
jgi:hypothetical protein